MRQFSDEQLMSYVDRELDESAAAEIRSAAVTDPELSRRIGIFAGSRRLLENAFQAKRSEPVPDRLLRVFHLRVEAREQQRKEVLRRIVARRNRGVPLAMAATVLVAVGAGFLFLSQRQPAATIAYVDSPEVLSAALEKNPSGMPYATDVGGAHHEVIALSTLHLRDGTWCREFDSAQFSGNELHRSRGVACRDSSGQWIARAVAPATQRAREPGAYELASGPSLVPAIGPADALTPDQEQAAINRDWKAD